MSDPGRGGPVLDELAAAAILKEDERHRRRLMEIEGSASPVGDELLAEENDLHLKLLTGVYAGLAERRFESGRKEEEVGRGDE
ncbi:MAG TPA: hypothetical protein VGQ99_09590 [Tepidisphaeraceae bacterium]|nr:hypothetical protein [Tepidisphaeraceae bacterium]